MKVILSFLAFGALAILVPPMLSTMVSEDDVAEYQIMQGADPTQVLEKTASGRALPSGSCDTNQYQFGKSKNGYTYIRDMKSDVLASVMDSKLKLFLLEKKVEVVSLDVDELDPRLARLGAVLGECEAGSYEPVVTGLLLNGNATKTTPKVQ